MKIPAENASWPEIVENMRTIFICKNLKQNEAQNAPAESTHKGARIQIRTDTKYVRAWTRNSCMNGHEIPANMDTKYVQARTGNTCEHGQEIRANTDRKYVQARTRNTCEHGHEILASTDTKYMRARTRNTCKHEHEICTSTDKKYVQTRALNTYEHGQEIRTSTDTKYVRARTRNTCEHVFSALINSFVYSFSYACLLYACNTKEVPFLLQISSSQECSHTISLFARKAENKGCLVQNLIFLSHIPALFIALI